MAQVKDVPSSPRYVPAENESYMCERQIAYFKDKLMAQQAKCTRKITNAVSKIKTLESAQADILDRSNAMRDLEFEVARYERYNSTLEQVEQALERIEDGSFGYCQLSGREIGLPRLEAIPFAVFSVQALEAFENGHF